MAALVIWELMLKLMTCSNYCTQKCTLQWMEMIKIDLLYNKDCIDSSFYSFTCQISAAARRVRGSPSARPSLWWTAGRPPRRWAPRPWWTPPGLPSRDLQPPCPRRQTGRCGGGRPGSECRPMRRSQTARWGGAPEGSPKVNIFNKVSGVISFYLQ